MTESEQSLLRAALALDTTDGGPTPEQLSELRKLQRLVHVSRMQPGLKSKWLFIQREYTRKLADLREWRQSSVKELGIPESFDTSEWHEELRRNA